METLRKKAGLLRGATILVFFIITGIAVSVARSNTAYFFMFSGIGIIAGLTECKIALYPGSAQLIRRISSAFLGGLLVCIALVIGINFQFSQIFIDLYAGIITGALIQFIAARLILPFIFGNIFCSRACWDGVFFEFLEENHKLAPLTQKKHVQYRSPSAWIYLFLIITLASFYGIFWTLPPGAPAIRWTFILLNVAIITIGMIASKKVGGRAYCRKLCPFITISGVISPFALFKVDPVNNQNCTKCRQCTKSCPMHIDVMSYVKEGKRINHPDCTMCEQCVSVCPENCLIVK